MEPPRDLSRARIWMAMASALLVAWLTFLIWLVVHQVLSPTPTIAPASVTESSQAN